jgi:hypothetical protein
VDARALLGSGRVRRAGELAGAVGADVTPNVSPLPIEAEGLLVVAVTAPILIASLHDGSVVGHVGLSSVSEGPYPGAPELVARHHDNDAARRLPSDVPGHHVRLACAACCAEHDRTMCLDCHFDARGNLLERDDIPARRRRC